MTGLSYIDGGKKVQHIEETLLIVSILQSEESNYVFIVGNTETNLGRVEPLIQGIMLSGRGFNKYDININPDKTLSLLEEKLSNYGLILSKDEPDLMMAGIYLRKLKIQDPEKLKTELNIVKSKENPNKDYKPNKSKLYEATKQCIDLLT